ncbi:MAG: type II toxin-antitoxin system RelE/ParE family toxin [Planctomycetota bacterium]|nr:type II toxin-antitoxin system RelE/ParE family toxin [Planctomycetota bacterium]
MSGRAIWRELAETDLTEAYLYIGADSAEAAERLLDAVGDAVVLLLENPQAGSPRDFRSPRARDVRSWAPQGFPN